MDIKREVKLYFSSHRDSFLFWFIVIISIITVPRLLNHFYKTKNKNNDDKNVSTMQSNITENKNYANKFEIIK